MSRLHLFLTVLLLTMLMAGSALGQTPEAPADTAATETPEVEETDLMKAESLIATMAAELDSLLVLLPRAKKADDEQMKLLRVSAVRHLELMNDAEPEFLKVLDKLDPEDPATNKVRQEGARFFVAKFDLYEDSVNFWNLMLNSLRGMRSETPEEELGDLEARIDLARKRIDDHIPEMVVVIRNAEALGVDVEQTWERFDRAATARAENLVGRLQISVDARNQLQKKLDGSIKAKAPEAEIASIRTQLQYAKDRVKGVAASLGSTTDILGSRGFETAPYRQFIIRTTGEISDKVLDPKVLWGLLRDALQDLGGWLRDNGPTVLVRLLIVVVIIFFFRLLFRLLWWLMRLVRMVKLTRLMVQLGNSIINPLATLFGLFAGLWFIGANPTTLLTGAGVAGVIIGFALQDSLSNLAAGFFILATRPFDVDDVIRTGTEVGTVKAMWIANTTIVTFDGRRLLIPNRKIWAEIIENRSVEPLRRADITVRVGYGEDLDRVIAILLDLVRHEGRVLDHPEPNVFVSGWADSWVEVAVRPWARNEDWWPLLQDLPRLVVQRFAAEGIEIPHPRMEMRGRAASGPVPHSGGSEVS